MRKNRYESKLLAHIRLLCMVAFGSVALQLAGLAVWNLTCHDWSRATFFHIQYTTERFVRPWQYGSSVGMAEEFKERRKRTRAPLHWTVYLRRRAQEEQVSAETRDVSSEGFYCSSPEPFAPGEVIDCTIVMAASGETGEPRRLSGRATVLRVEPAGPHLFGIACRLEDYSLNTSADPLPGRMTFHGR